MDGILCLDKPQDITSFGCCAVVRRLMKEKKIGHAGTLDPMATGVLPLLLGKATRALSLLPRHDKRYTAVLRFGLTSDTEDIWGKVTAIGGSLPSREQIEEALPLFRGEIRQTPPMMSAVKQGGVRLYELARQGKEVERESRTVTVYSLNAVEYREETGELTLDCHCSQGTYIRTLCSELGKRLGCGAVMTDLRRTMAAGFELSCCVTLQEAERLAEQGELASRLLPVETVFADLPLVTVTVAQAVRFGNGGALSLDRLRVPVLSDVRVRSPEGEFLGLGRPEEGQLKVLRLFARERGKENV